MATKKKAPATAKKWQYETSENTKGDLYIKGMTPPGVAMWPFVFKCKLTYQGKMKEQKGEPVTSKDWQYSLELLFSKKDPLAKDMFKIVEKLSADHFGIKPDKLSSFPIKDGDDKDKEEYEGKYYMTLSMPQDAGPLPVFDTDMDEMVNPSDFYAGCWAAANVAFKTYTTAGRKGVTLYLQSVIKIDDGERIGFDRSKSEREKIKKTAPTKGVKIVNGEVVYN